MRSRRCAPPPMRAPSSSPCARARSSRARPACSDGRPCTTHWMHADELARRFPTARVDRNVLFVDDGNLITSAGTAAGIDACLHLVRRELGSEVTNKIARRMVVPPQRDGGQRQYIDQPIPVRCSEGFAPHLDWILTNLDKPHTVATLARRASMSARTFAQALRRRDRHDADAMGHRPAGALCAAAARGERSRHRPDRRPVGFGTATLLRHHFRRIIGVTPSDYRRSFACSMDPECGPDRLAKLVAGQGVYPPPPRYALEVVLATFGERAA